MPKGTVIFLVAALIAMQTGCASKPEVKQTSNINGLQPTSSIMLSEAEVQKEMKENQKANEEKQPAEQKPQKMVITFYFVGAQSEKLSAEKRTVEVKDSKNLSEVAGLALEGLAKGPLSGNMFPVFPKEVPTPTVKVVGGTATVDFTKAFVEKHVGGSSGESLTIYSVVNTLCGIDGIKQVQFTVDGKKAESFKGHMDITKPLVKDLKLVQ